MGLTLSQYLIPATGLKHGSNKENPADSRKTFSILNPGDGTETRYRESFCQLGCQVAFSIMNPGNGTETILINMQWAINLIYFDKFFLFN